MRQLVENADRLINRDEIMDAIWPGVVVTDDSTTASPRSSKKSAADGRAVAEIAVSVAPAHRRCGLGSDLVTRVFDAVARDGADAAVFEFDPCNGAIQALVRNLGGQVTPHAESCLISLPAPKRWPAADQGFRENSQYL